MSEPNIFTHAVVSDLKRDEDGTSTFTLSKPGEPEVFSVTTPPNIGDVRAWLASLDTERKEREFEKDMSERDEGAAIVQSGVVNLHADLDDREILRAVERWKDKDITFVLDESDSTPANRTAFRRLWSAAGGPYIATSAEEIQRLIKGSVN